MDNKEALRVNQLISINIAITYRCMLRCKMCDMWKINDPDELSIDGWKKFISNLKTSTNKSFLINFAGGEPLMKEGILELVSFCAQEKFDTYIGTNGYLIDEGFAKRIADSGLSTIGLSLESLDEDTHDWLRGVKGTYGRVMAAIESLGRHSGNPRIVISTIILEKNLDGLIPLVEWVNNHDRLSGITFQAIMQTFNTSADINWYKKQDHNLLWPKDSGKACGVIDELVKMKRETKCKILNPVSQLHSFKSYFEAPEKFNTNSGCKLAGKAIDIEARGTVKLCFNMEEAGNVKNNTLEEILNSQKAVRIAERMNECTERCHFLINCFYKD